MWSKLIFMAIVVVAPALASQVALAADEVHEGKVLSAGDGKLTVFDKRDSDNDTFIVNAETKISPQR